MYLNVQSIQDSIQDSKEVTQKSCSHEIIYLNNIATALNTRPNLS